jgi:hypothetical protein
MSALTKDRNTPARMGDKRVGLVAAAVTIHAGALLMRDASGYLTPGATTTGAVGAGRALEPVDNAAGAAGDKTVTFDAPVSRFFNSAGADEITVADIGSPCFIVDDQTVAKSDGTATRSPAGIVEDVDTLGVWVRFDEGLTKAATA